MASSPAATATSSAFSRRPSSYDVFISFRGADTRRDFVSLLYKALIRDGIHVFIDSEELWEGEEICPSLQRAIRGSKISIPVFSQHYADSKYCLSELAEIWECHLSDAQTVLPIFVGVEPHDVRHQTKSFHEPFQQYQSMCESSAMVESWKNGLKEVGNLKGWTLKEGATIEEQSNIVEFAVQRVLRELGSTPLDECEYLVGIDSHVTRLLSLLNIGSDDVRFVAICGMGGLGKTTIAKAIYNRIFRNFKRSSFLSDVREEASHGNNGLVSLQNRLLQDILKRNFKIGIVSRGSKLIEERLHREKILLILDDVDDHEQLDALAGGLNWFGQGSKVIITTRDVHILNVHKGKVGKDIQIYMPGELNFKNSLLLFSLHAFSKNEPPENYKQLSHEVVRYAEGLPLTLEVLGSFLIDKNREEWEDTLERLKDILNDKVSGKSIKSYDDKVFGKLMISYNKLGDPEKVIFLDVACHFSGCRKEKAISIWEACELHPRLAIKELIQKHLLKIDAEGKLWMHDQLRYMGRRIVSKDGYRDPTKRSRLWSQDEILNVLKNYMGTQMVEGILLDHKFDFEAGDVLSYEDFMKMPNLRFLQVCSGNLNGDFSRLPSSLKWFCWEDCDLESLPANFYHEELVHLELSQNCIEQAWNNTPQNQNKRFQKLKVLMLCFCHKLCVSPNFFSWFPCLQILNIYGCHSLLELPDSICQMASLKGLILSECLSFKKLPESIVHLQHLVKLSVNGTKIEELPDGVGQLEKLEDLNVSDCQKLVKLPTSMGRMSSLHHFHLSNTMIIKLPADFSKLSSLEVLRMGMPWYTCSDLYQTHHMSLVSLPELPSTLISLQVEFYNSLQIIPDLSHQERLKELIIYSCKGLRYLGKLPTNLIHLSCSCKSLVRFPDLSYLKSLRRFDVTNCENLEKIQGLEGTESLEELNVPGCHRLIELSDLSKLKSLRKLDIRNCENLQEIHGLGGTESLEKLKVSGCKKLTEIPDLSKLKRLRKLDITNCENLEEIHGLEGTESLEELKAQGCYRLTELLGLSKLKRLGKLDITDCENLEKIHGLDGTESLEELKASGCHKLTELLDLSKLKRLRKLDITYCENLEKIDDLEGTESLEEFKASGCNKLRKLPDLSKMKRLSQLHIFNCENLGEIHGLKGTESLKELDARGCYKITETMRKIHGQGRLLHNVGEGQGNTSIADDEIYNGSPILCVVFEFTPKEWFEPEKLQAGEVVNITFHIDASICWRGNNTRCRHSIRIEDIEFTYRDIIYIHHFKGFDWFGFPLENEDAIEELHLGDARTHSHCGNLISGWSFEVKFWKCLIENKGSEQQMPNPQSSATLVADFFRWLDADEEEEEEEEEEVVEVEEEEEEVVVEVEEEERGEDNTTVDCLSCLGFRVCF